MNSPATIWRHHKNLRTYLNKTGRLLVWTKILVAPLGFEHEVPYFAGIVQFIDGEKLPVQIVDCNEEDFKTNLKVKTVIRKMGKAKSEDVIEYTVKVKPL